MEIAGLMALHKKMIKMGSTMEHGLKERYKRDIVFIAVLLAVSIAAYAVINIVFKKDGTTIVIKVDGEALYELPIARDGELSLEGYQGGSNRVVIQNGSVAMTEADCPDKLCVKTGKISKTGESIVCLPHRVVIEIRGGGQKVDSVVQ